MEAILCPLVTKFVCEMAIHIPEKPERTSTLRLKTFFIMPILLATVRLEPGLIIG